MTQTHIDVNLLKNNEIKKFKYIYPSKDSEIAYLDSFIKIIEFYTEEEYDYSSINYINNIELSYNYDSGGNVIVDVIFSLNSPYSGSFIETGALSNSGAINFTGNVGTFTDSNGYNIRVTAISNTTFTFENLTLGVIYDSSTGKMTPI